jgi:hypothetical protein
MRITRFFPLLLAVAACGEGDPPPNVPSSATPNVAHHDDEQGNRVLMSAGSTAFMPAGGAPGHGEGAAAGGEGAEATGEGAEGADKVLVLQTTKLDRYAEVVGVVDVHEAMGSDQAALALLRRKAAAMGADAVVGVEFHHGEAEGEPTHLSGMAVRFVPSGSLPRE